MITIHYKLEIHKRNSTTGKFYRVAELGDGRVITKLAKVSIATETLASTIGLEALEFAMKRAKENGYYDWVLPLAGG